MGKIYIFFPVVLMQVSSLIAQNLSSGELINAWKVSDKTQTLRAEETYDDLRLNYSENSYNKIIPELYSYLKKNPDTRLEIRILIYEALAQFNQKKKLSAAKEDQLMNLFKKVLMLGDKQLLSELYSLYAEQGPESLEDKLYYNTSSTAIQERIGAEYFPKIYLRYLSLSLSYYSMGDYRESIRQGLKSLQIIEKKGEPVFDYSLQMDVLGSCYYELNKVDSGLYYYRKIQDLLAVHKSNPKNGFNKKDSNLWEVWKGVSDGGIARGLMMKGNYKEAIPFLVSNINSSTRHHQPGDLAKAKNLLAETYFRTRDTKNAIVVWKDAYKLGLELPPGNRYLVSAADGIAKGFKSMNRYDSAYFYLQKKVLFEKNRYNEISQSRLHAVNARLQFEKMENTIKEAEHTIQKQNSNRNLILAGSAGILLILLFSYSKYRFRQKIKFKNLETEQKIAKIEKQRIENELKTAKSNIQAFIDKVNEKNELIENISQKLDELNQAHSFEKTELNNALTELRNTKIITDDDWTEFQKGFDRVYKNFSKNLFANFPSITPSEQRYLMLTKIGLSHKEMARALGISNDSVRVTWNRVRNKLEGSLDDTPQSLLEKINEEVLIV